MELNDDLSQLDKLLTADVQSDRKSHIHEIDIFSNISDNSAINNNETKLTESTVEKSSAIHNGDTDSSEDEERRVYSERKYSDYGTEIKKVLDYKNEELKDKQFSFQMRLRETNSAAKQIKKNSLKTISSKDSSLSEISQKKPLQSDIFTDPVFGIRIVKPLVSNSGILDSMQGRHVVSMSQVKKFVETKDLSQDWVIAGVIVRKSLVKKSQKGNPFIIWTLSDLKDDLKTISMFLFQKAYKDLWKSSEGTVVAILNPCVLDKSQNSFDQACLSVDSSERVMILGQSKDYGLCKSRKKNGDPCTAFVNLNQCQHCIYHVKQEYQKYSKRQELQSSTMGKGLVNIQKKVFGKNNVIYGGKTYSAYQSGNTKKVIQKYQNRLMLLSDYYKNEDSDLMINKAPYCGGAVKPSPILHSPSIQKMNDKDRLTKLDDKSSSASLADKVASSPKLGKGLTANSIIDLNVSYRQKSAEKAKMAAIKLVKQHGGINKTDPNNTRGNNSNKKRTLNQACLTDDENDSKKIKHNDTSPKSSIMSDRFRKILEATSSHQNLIQDFEDNEQEKYFNRLEKKEAMEEKMLSTYKLECKAVRCSKCKYTAFSAAEICKNERHPLRVLDTFKRFFKCGDCGNRTLSLEVIPLHSCSNCKSSKWEKAPMMREKKITNLSGGLSIRGEEEKFIGGLVTAGKNINLLVGDE